MGFFFGSIALIGTLGVSLAAPFLLLGRGWRDARRVGGILFRRGVYFLLWAQPWLRADVRIAPRASFGPNRSPGTLYISNHRSTLDVFFLLANVTGVRILSKRKLLLVPFLGEVMWLTRQIFVTKEHADFVKAMRQIERGLADGEAMHVFPEYTRCTPGFQGTQKFSAAPFQAAIAAGAPVVPIVFRDTDRVWPKGIYGLRFRTPVRVESLPAVPAGQFASARELMQEVKSRIDRALETSA